jgi:hypothetical protein
VRFPGGVPACGQQCRGHNGVWEGTEPRACGVRAAAMQGPKGEPMGGREEALLDLIWIP